MSEWKETQLEELIDIKHGYAFKGEYFSEVPNNNILLTPGNFHIGGGFKNDKFKYYTGDIPKDYILSEGDVIVTMTDLSKAGDTLGYSAKIPKSNKTFLHNQRLGLIEIISEETDKNFIYWLLRTRHYQKTIVNSCSGSTVKHTSPTKIRDYLFLLPPLQEQKAIASVLSCLDAKIENLRRQNETLEAIAQTLFKHWFIDFEFPNEDGKPYKSSGGEMRSSELGEIPVGWQVGKLGDLVQVINGYSYKGTDLGESDTALINLKNFNRTGGFRLDGFKEITTLNYQEKHLVNPNDLLVAHTDLTQNAEVLGNPILVQPLDKYFKYVMSMDLVRVESKVSKINNFFLYYLLSTRFFKYHCIGYANGTKVLHLSKKAVPEYEFAMPDNYNCIQKFQELASVNRKKITNNEKQIQTLTKTRDTLLPKLMSGQIRITN